MTFKDLLAYQKAYENSMIIFELSKKFPREEVYSLTDQIRRSSRSVCANIAEAYRKRRYEKHFISKLTDSVAENSETQTWLDYAKDCDYLDIESHKKCYNSSIEVGKLINYMIRYPNKFGVKQHN